jgi:hypothetical protein
LPERYNDLSLLKWVTDVYHMRQAWDDAQAKGEVPFDENFDPFLVFFDGRTGKRSPYWISAAAQVDIQKLYKKGEIASPVTCGFIGEDERGTLRGIEFLRINETHGLIELSGIKAQSFPPRSAPKG